MKHLIFALVISLAVVSTAVTLHFPVARAGSCGVDLTCSDDTCGSGYSCKQGSCTGVRCCKCIINTVPTATPIPTRTPTPIPPSPTPIPPTIAPTNLPQPTPTFGPTSTPFPTPNASSNKAVSFYYNSQGQRIAKIDPQGINTYYLSPNLEVTYDAQGKLGWRKNYFFNGRLVSIRSSD